ncbi:unnamed protein product [Adineta steineri]|uniref:Uncharacterized protein n=1 Tax=Adineta steineri TaxID=433720 RepID=A0A814P1V9_9BILA|nr:unnamed protein product [Adineta steineri]
MGLDGLGKATIAYKFKLHEIAETISSRYRRTYCNSSSNSTIFSKYTSIYFFIDCLYDNTRLEEATEELWSLLSENVLKKLPLLIYLNKIDLEYRLKQDDILLKYG